MGNCYTKVMPLVRRSKCSPCLIAKVYFVRNFLEESDAIRSHVVQLLQIYCDGQKSKDTHQETDQETHQEPNEKTFNHVEP